MTMPYGLRVMSPTSCQLLYPASNSNVILPIILNSVNPIREK